MSEIAGLWDYELETLVQLSTKNGAMRVTTHDGSDLVVKVEHIAPERICPDWMLV